MTTSLRTDATERSGLEGTRHRAEGQAQIPDESLPKDPEPKIKSSTHQGITIRRGTLPPSGAEAKAGREARC
jgi:hypothetical protein